MRKIRGLLQDLEHPATLEQKELDESRMRLVVLWRISKQENMSIPEEKISNILIGCRQLQKKPVFTYVCILLSLAYIDKYTFQF